MFDTWANGTLAWFHLYAKPADATEEPTKGNSLWTSTKVRYAARIRIIEIRQQRKLRIVSDGEAPCKSRGLGASVRTQMARQGFQTGNIIRGGLGDGQSVCAYGRRFG
jgi:hypothetical protein